MAESSQRDWRDLCAAASAEPNSKKLADLVDEIIRALDERSARSSRRLEPASEP